MSDELPEAVAVAAFDFCVGSLASNPQRVGTRLGPLLDNYFSARRGTYRVIYSITRERGPSISIGPVIAAMFVARVPNTPELVRIFRRHRF